MQDIEIMLANAFDYLSTYPLEEPSIYYNLESIVYEDKWPFLEYDKIFWLQLIILFD